MGGNENLYEFLNQYTVLGFDSIILLQPAKCLQCQPSILQAIDTILSANIFIANGDSCTAKYQTQRCFFYDKIEFSEKGLSKFYSELLIVKHGKIVEKIPLFK